VDDNEETVANRLKVYESETAPLVAFYEKRNLLRVVDAQGDIDDVYRRIQALAV
jgi:adenylate kinase